MVEEVGPRPGAGPRAVRTTPRAAYGLVVDSSPVGAVVAAHEAVVTPGFRRVMPSHRVLEVVATSLPRSVVASR